MKQLIGRPQFQSKKKKENASVHLKSHVAYWKGLIYAKLPQKHHLSYKLDWTLENMDTSRGFPYSYLTRVRPIYGPDMAGYMPDMAGEYP